MTNDHSSLLDSGRLLPVMEEFYSLQGEGFHTGEAAWFIRIGGCDVGCSWCDVKESWNARLFPPVDTDDVVARALACPANAVIVTGGEPLLYNLNYLCTQLKANSQSKRSGDPASAGQPIANRSEAEIPLQRDSQLQTFLETSGSQPLTGTWDWICLSPKPGSPPLEPFYAIAHELKVIIQTEEDLRWAEQQAERVHPGARRFLQPEWSHSADILPVIISYIQSHPSWRLSLQTHKYIGIP